MEVSVFLISNLVSICLLLALFSAIFRPPGWAWWSAVNLAVAGAIVLALVTGFDDSGFIAALLFVPLIAVPAVGSYLSRRAFLSGRIASAAKLLRFITPFHPTPALRLESAILAAQALADPSAQSKAFSALMAANPDQTARIMMTARLEQADWAGILAALDAMPNAAAYAAMRIRSLGETGNIDAMVDVFSAFEGHLTGDELTVSQLAMLAFSGKRQGVAKLLERPLAMLGGNAKAYWTAIAGLHNGETEQARAVLAGLAQQGETARLRAAAKRHAVSEAAPAPLSTHAQAIADAAEMRVLSAYAQPKPSLKKSWLTLAFIIVCALVFATELMRGGAEDAETLIAMGALAAPLVIEDGDYFRLISAGFLHFGWLHFIANMLLLALLGPALEMAAGWRRMAMIYVFGLIVSGAAVLGHMVYLGSQHDFMVGASGAIFAVLGALIAGRVRRFMAHRRLSDRRSVVLLAAVIAVQLAIDATIPAVSMVAHMAGLAAGLLAGFALLPRERAGS